MTQILKSKIDASTNFVLEGNFEARYVHRPGEAVICYLSSHRGCNQACRFCHLTQLGQTDMTAATMKDFENQAALVLQEWAMKMSDARAGTEYSDEIHFNFMARGEPLMNSVLVKRWADLQYMLRTMAKSFGFTKIKFKVSTIMPREMPDFFDKHTNCLPELYYSLYSVNDVFRKRWLPKAYLPSDAACMLQEYRSWGGKVVLHQCFIAGENDSWEDLEGLRHFLYKYELQDVDINIVRYNPYSYLQGQESPLIGDFERYLGNSTTGRVQIIPRVGFDVKASCGMFVDDFKWKFGDVAAMPSKNIKLYPVAKI